MTIFDEMESAVRSYCRSFPAVFDRAKDCFIYDRDGKPYLDFLSGAGALNYGHNNSFIKGSLQAYIDSDRITHGLDMHTVAKGEFIEAFRHFILAPRKLDYRLQFCGPTGTNAVEAAVKLARKVTGRRKVFAFMGGYHGMTLGALALTGNKYYRDSTVTLSDTVFMPFPHKFMASFDTIEYISQVLDDPSSGIDIPAAIIVETVQAEGGVIPAPVSWLKRLQALCRQHGIVLIVDDVQVGCYRTGPFFSFERAGLEPDLVVLSKSLGGYGLPISMLLVRPELDASWLPGEHNGTFRGNQLAFVAARSALQYASDHQLWQRVEVCAAAIDRFFEHQILPLHPGIRKRGLGLIWGLDFEAVAPDITQTIVAECFGQGLIVERAGRDDAVIKLLPPLVISDAELQMGLETLRDAIESALESTAMQTDAQMAVLEAFR